MKRLALIILGLLVWAFPANATISLVAHVLAETAGQAGPATTSAINTTGANFIVIGVSTNAPTGGTITDSLTGCASPCNTWIRLTAQQVGTNAGTVLFFSANPTVGTNHVFVYTNANQYPSLAVAAFSGVATSSPKDQENGANSGASQVGSLQTGSVTPSANNELVVTSIASSGSPTFSINSSFTITDQTPSGGGFWLALGYLIQTTATAVNPTWSLASGNQFLATDIASFKASAATTAPTQVGAFLPGP